MPRPKGGFGNSKVGQDGGRSSSIEELPGPADSPDFESGRAIARELIDAAEVQVDPPYSPTEDLANVSKETYADEPPGELVGSLTDSEGSSESEEEEEESDDDESVQRTGR